MTPNPMLGLLFHWLGGLASASFYVPYKGVRRWSWEIFWLTGGVFSWLLGPWVFAALQTENLLGVLGGTPGETLFWCLFFGALWGLGGLTYGLTMRYLGLSLGMAIALGLTTAFGTLVPPIFAGDFHEQIIATTSGNVILGGIGVAMVGILTVARAGHEKDAAQNATGAVTEFAFRKGLGVAIFSGIMSSCFAYGLAAGEPIREASLAAGTGHLWQGLPVLCVVLVGGFLTNFLWCLWLIVRNRSAAEWLGGAGRNRQADGARIPLTRNYLLCALGGTMWYFQFFFYTMGESQMGRFGFSSWTLHMASIIIFGTLWGFAFNEWRDAPPRTRAMVWAGVALLVLSTVIIGWGNAIAT